MSYANPAPPGSGPVAGPLGSWKLEDQAAPAALPSVSAMASGYASSNSTLLVTPTLTASSTSTPSSISANPVDPRSSYLGGAGVSVVALGAAFVNL